MVGSVLVIMVPSIAVRRLVIPKESKITQNRHVRVVRGVTFPGLGNFPTTSTLTGSSEGVEALKGSTIWLSSLDCVNGFLSELPVPHGSFLLVDVTREKVIGRAGAVGETLGNSKCKRALGNRRGLLKTLIEKM
jgi:hypothetical protein